SVFFSSYGAPPDLHSFPTRRSSDLNRLQLDQIDAHLRLNHEQLGQQVDFLTRELLQGLPAFGALLLAQGQDSLVDRFCQDLQIVDRKSTRLNSSHDQISYAVFCLKK